MALTFTKAKVQKVAAVVGAAHVLESAPPKTIADTKLVSDFAELIDRVGTLEAGEAAVKEQIKKLTASLKPLNDARAELAEMIDGLELDDDAVGQELGAAFYVEYGKRGSSREISDMDKLKELLGVELFMQLATVTLKDVDSYLTPPQKEQVLITNRTKRTLKVSERVE